MFLCSPGHSFSVLLCATEENHPQDDANVKARHIPTLRELCPAIDLPDDAIGKVFTVLVPSQAPLTRAQYEAASAVWPVTFHEDK